MSRDKRQCVAPRFNECINNRDVGGLAKLMTDDHAFIDTGNYALRGKEKVLEAWTVFFDSFPDYQNIFESVASEVDTVTMIGRSACSDHRLAGPAIWTAKISDNKVAEWRVYNDTLDTRRRLGF